MTTSNESHDGAFPEDARAAAELYLAKGFAPVPLPPRSKRPEIAGWRQLRITAGALDGHFPPGQARNVAVLNGEPSGGLLDVDLDCREAGRAAPFLLPATAAVFGRPGSPRSHWLYRTTPALDAAQEKYSFLGVALEMRGTGGLTVFPPSTHQGTGESVAWHRWGDPAALPLDRLRKAARELAAASLFARHWPPKGTRNQTALALSGALARSGWDIARVGRFVHAVATAAGDEEARARAETANGSAEKVRKGEKATGWPTLVKLLGEPGEAVVRKAREWLGSGGDRPAEPRKSRPAPPYAPFPVDALPPEVAGFVRAVSEAVGVDPAMAALPALAACAGAIGNSRAVLLKKGWSEPSSLWAAVVSRSGSGKSPPFSLATGPLSELQIGALEAHEEAKSAYDAALLVHKRMPKDERGDEPQKPEPPRRVMTSDTTVEALGEILRDAPKGLLVATDELDGWFQGFVRYKGRNGGSDRGKWLELHRAGNLMLDRITRERGPLHVRRALVSVCGTIQPRILARALDPESRESGLGARLLLAMPPVGLRVWSDAEMPDEVTSGYRKLIGDLVGLRLKDAATRSPHFLALSPAAKGMFTAFVNELGLRQFRAEDDEHAAVLAKIEGAAARLALVHHVVTHATDGSEGVCAISAEAMEAGIALARWFANEWLRVQAVLTESDEAAEARKLVELLRENGGKLTSRELMRRRRGTYGTAEEAAAALGRLVEAGWARWAEEETGRLGGLKTNAVELVDAGDTDDTDDEEAGGSDDGGGDTGGGDGRRPDDAPPTNPSGDKGMQPDSWPDDAGGVAAVTAVTAVTGEGGSSDASRPSGGGVTPPAYRLVSDRGGLQAVALAIGGSSAVSLDVETTGLNPLADRVRLISLATDTTDGGTFCYLIDCFAIDPTPLWEALAAKELVLHNAAFGLTFLARMGFTPAGEVRDTMLLAQLLAAGTDARVGLAACCKRWLGRDLDKAGRKSDWSGTLTAEQLEYAALDVEVLVPLLKTLNAEIEGAELDEAARIEEGCLPAVVWMAGSGVAINADGWRRLADGADAEARRLREELDAAAPDKPDELFGGAWNWDSHPQALKALRSVGCDAADTSDGTLAALTHPLAGLLRRYREAQKAASSHGEKWLAHAGPDGRVRPRWRQIGARSGRMSCRGPNMQQLPGGPHRRCVVAPPGRVLVKADYSQIELRIAAKVSGDEELLAAYQRGEDLHAITARNVLGIEEVTKDHRQLAKALNFGLLFGMGADGFRLYAKRQYGLDLSEAEARWYRAAFFRSYPGLAGWHRRTGREAVDGTRTLAGRRRLGLTSFTQRLNTPVQGTGADGLKLALAFLWERRGQASGAFPVLAAHDEIVVEADAEAAEAASAWLRSAMLEAMAPLIAPVPVEVEVKVGRTWGGD